MEKTKTDEKKAEKAAIVPKVSPKTDTSKVYELAVLLLPSLNADALEKEVASITHEFTSRGGELISSEMPVMIDLAYSMIKVVHTNRQKCQEAYFGWMKFEIETEMINDIKKFLDGNEYILRYLLIKTVHENTLINGKMNLGRDESADDVSIKISDDGERIDEATGEPIQESEIGALDKTIDDLVIA